MGIDERRLRLKWISASEGAAFAEEIRVFVKELKELGISFSLRICSAHRSPEVLEGIVSEFLDQDGEVFICVAGMSAHLAGVVAAMSTKPVLAVPVYRKETSGLDSLLSMGQMPKGIPVGTLGFGNSGFINACLLASQILATSDKKLAKKLI